MKKVLLFSVIIGLIPGLSPSGMHAMKRRLQEEEAYKPTIPMADPQTGEGYFTQMPADIKAQVTMALYTAKDLQEAVKAIRALAVGNKAFNTLINTMSVTKNLVHMLIEKFGGFHEWVAKTLATPGAQEYLAQNDLSTAKTLEDLLKRPGFDTTYLNRHGQGIIVMALKKKWAPKIIRYLIEKKRVPLYIPDVSATGDPQAQHELKIFIIASIAQAPTLAEAVAAMQNELATSPEFKTFINNPTLTRIVVNMLAAKYGVYTAIAAQQLATEGALKYVATNEASKEKMSDAVYLEEFKFFSVADVKKLVASEQLDPRYREVDGNGPLCWAYLEPFNENAAYKYTNRIDILQYLMHQGADIDMVTQDGSTVLLEAIVQNGDSLGPDYNYHENLFKFILHAMNPQLINMPRQHNNARALPLLIEHGLNEYESHQNYTRLPAFFNLIELLLDAGANPLLKDSHGRSIIDILHQQIAQNPREYLLAQRLLQFIQSPAKRPIIKKIMTIIAQAQTLDEAITHIQAEAGSYLFINDLVSLRDIVGQLLTKFGVRKIEHNGGIISINVDHETIARKLNIPGVPQYLAFHNRFIGYCQRGISLQQAEGFIKAGGDFGFVNSQQKSCGSYYDRAVKDAYYSWDLSERIESTVYVDLMSDDEVSHEASDNEDHSHAFDDSDEENQ